MPPSYPDGLDLEIFTCEALLLAESECNSKFQREHVTPWMRESGRLRVSTLQHSQDLSALRWTVDEPEDLEVVRAVVSHFGNRSDFSWQQVLMLQQQQPALFAANAKFVRNEGATIGEGQKSWLRAKRVIPGGNMLLSKRVEMFLPEKWPAYFSKANGCRVWDLDGRELIDMSIMGIGSQSARLRPPTYPRRGADRIRKGSV